MTELIFLIAVVASAYLIGRLDQKRGRPWWEPLPMIGFGLLGAIVWGYLIWPQ